MQLHNGLGYLSAYISDVLARRSSGHKLEKEEGGYIQVGLAFLSWFISSILLTGLNKLLFHGADGHRLGATLVCSQALLISILLAPLIGLGVVNLDFVNKYNILICFLPIAVFAAGDILATNMAYSYVSVSVVVVIKSCASCVTYVVATIFMLNKFSYLKFGCTIFICLAVSVSVDEMPIDNVFGVFLGIIAVILCALRWTMIQRFMQGVNDNNIDRKITSLEMLSVLQPLMCCALLPICLIHDLPPFLSDALSTDAIAPPAVVESLPLHPPISMADHMELMDGLRGHRRLSEFGGLVDGELEWGTKAWMVGLSAIFAMVCILSEIYVVKHTSSTTLCVGGVFKEMVTLIGSHFVFGDQISSRGIVAIASSLLGILAYAYLDIREHILVAALGNAIPTVVVKPANCLDVSP